MKKLFFKGVILMSISILLSSCFGRYSIKVVSGKEYLDTCPISAKPGDTVKVTTVYVTDADLYLNGNVEIKKISDAEFEFVMPEYDVELKITVISNGLA
ncbi:MAG: hypothetical protein J6S49_00755 [Erysipelotrichaceae bacterium]|nr:hypothetical protein [Erysipelotrichaceae bacterium]